MGTRILIIKLGALGDVVRTASLLPTLKREFPQSHIHWISKPNGVRILANHPQIDVLWTFDAEGILAVTQQKYDLVISLDKEPAPVALCNAAIADEKRGVGMSKFGTATPLDEAGLEYFKLGLDDDTKFNVNTKTYPQLIHDALKLPYAREPYKLYCDESSIRRAEKMFAPWRKSASAIVGLNTGAGDVFAHKAPSVECWIEICKFFTVKGLAPVLLGGPGEKQLNDAICTAAGLGVYRAGSDNTEQQFTAIVSQCDVLVTGDTLGLHVGVARGIPVVGLFGPTCHQEIDLFDNGVKIISPMTCGPCYKRSCDIVPSCMDAISPAEIVTAAANLLQG